VAALTVAVDFDGTLVRDGVWVPGAADAVRELWRRDALVVVHTCRANRPDGLEVVQRALADLGVPPVGPRGGRRLHVHADVGKPHADVYVDDKALRFDGDWAATLAQLAIRRP
jgi:hypothetical protein